MNSADSEGLGLSVLVYLGAILGALTLFAAPVYYATRAEVHENPPLAQSDPLLNGTVIIDRTATRFPLERLQRQNLAEVDPVVAPKAKIAKAEKRSEPTARVAAPSARRDNATPNGTPNGTPMAELQNERRTSVFPFSLF